MLKKLGPLMLALLLAGCQGKADLSGKVSYQGTPVEVGSVHAVGSDGIIKPTLIKNGQYSLKGLPAGPVKLTVTSPDPATQRVGVRNPDRPPPQTADPGKWFALPEKYANFNTSELIFPLTPGPNNIDLQLK